MSISEAAQLVIKASHLSEGKEIYVLEMGKPIKIFNLAKQMIKLSGFREDEIDIIFTGLRGGEKLYEELLVDADALTTPHPRIMRAREQHVSLEILVKGLADSIEALKTNNIPRFRAILAQLDIGYQPPTSGPHD